MMLEQIRMFPPRRIGQLVPIEFPAAFRAARFGESAQVVSAKRTQHVGCVRSLGLGGFHGVLVYRGDMDGREPEGTLLPLPGTPGRGRGRGARGAMWQMAQLPN